MTTLLPRGRVAQLLLPLSVPSFRAYWGELVLSAAGGSLQAVALAWFVLTFLGSSATLVGVLASGVASFTLGSLLGGALADRFGVRKLLLATDAARSVAAAALFLLAASRERDVISYYVVQIVFGVAGGLGTPARDIAIPALVPSEAVPAANSVRRVSYLTAIAAGSASGGILVSATAPFVAFAVNAVALAIAALLSATLPTGASPIADSRERLLLTLVAGFKYVRHAGWLRSLLLLLLVQNFATAGPITIALPLVAANNSRIGPEGLGLIIGSFVVGDIGGSLIAGTLSSLRRPRIVICLAGIASGPFLALIATPPLTVACAAALVAGGLSGLDTIVFLSHVQEAVPRELLGRVMALVSLALVGLQPLSQVVTGVIAPTLEPWQLFLAAGAAVSLASLVTLLSMPASLNAAESRSVL